MKRNNTWRFLLVVFVLIWSFFEIYPPQSRDLLQEFKATARNADNNFQAILKRAEEFNQQLPGRTYGNLRQAIGTNDITRYFPQYGLAGETDKTRAILNRVQKQAAGKIKLGLDLQGGQSFLVAMDTNNVASLEKERVLSQAVEVLRKRVDKFGVAEPIIQPSGEDRILIQLPGLSEAEKENARTTIQKAAFLEFRMVHPRSDELASQGLREAGYEILHETSTAPDGSKLSRPYLVSRKPEGGLTGKFVKSAMVIRDPVSNQPQIEFTLDTEGATIFAKITRENTGRQLAIVLDGELQSAPVINEEIPSGRAVISGSFDLKEAFALANVLENPLEAPVSIIEERGVDPSLGKDSIRSGIRAVIIGTVAVSGFMLVYYLLAGLIANVALISNVLILLGVMSSISAALTLPGIAGILLTVGMAVDANVLIYERIREELGKGKSLRGSISAGYDRAFSTIFDSHVTTLISSIILIYLGTGPIKGFGVTLSIGVAASLFTALVVTRLIFDFLLHRDKIKSLPMLHIIRSTKFDFMRLAKPAFAISWLLIIIGMGYGFKRAADNNLFGVEFVGGDTLTLGFEKRVEVDQLREAIVKTGVGESMIQYQRDVAGGSENLRVTTPTGTAATVAEALNKAFPEAKFKTLGQDRVGATVGKEIQKSAIIACVLSLFGILLYVAFRYEFSFAVASVVAVIHDVLMTLGWYCLSGREFNALMVAAVLTIIGFSINDTIVIFDRIREDLKLGVRGTFKDVMNQALNQTLSRTIITSGTVFLATMALYLFGGGVINDFAFTFLIGIFAGTYSSIYIACALVLWWHRGERPKTGSTVTIDNAVNARA